MKQVVKRTIHCVNCGSEDIVMDGTACRWNVQKQDWILYESLDPLLFHCQNCFVDAFDYDEREVSNGY